MTHRKNSSNDLDSEASTGAEPESTTGAEPESTTGAEPDAQLVQNRQDIEAPDLTIMSKHPTIDCLNGVFDKFVVFGMYVMGTPEAPPDLLLTTLRSVLAQYLDNDEDGSVDNQKS